MQSTTTINPATGESIKEYQYANSDQIQSVLRKAHDAYLVWRTTRQHDRCDLLINLSEALISKKKSLANLVATEMGKPLNEGVAEIEKCAWLCRYYAQHAEEFLSDEWVDTENKMAIITHQPIGSVLAIMPWNYPFWQVFRCAVPALVAGNSVILKHAPNVFGCAEMIEKLFRESGFENHEFQQLRIRIEDMEEVISSPVIQAITLTGSSRAGKSVAQLAGKYLKKCVFELGGSDAYLVLKDADSEVAVNACATSRLLNNGQSCISAKRFIVHKDSANAFLKGLRNNFESRTFGDPTELGTRLGPMAREDLRNNIHRQVQESIAAGADCIMGGEIPSGVGYFYPPTILTGVKPGMPAFDEEMFGPVASVIIANSDEEAILLANQSQYGLGGAVFSRDEKKALHIAMFEMQSGSCAVNTLVRSDPRLPFGGVKESGFGRELSKAGLLEFVNVKTVIVGE
ncbi:MAG: aldehyde dehydrogenase family protein [Bacteroidetes bacterium]|nr:aldehyde dehydrogenase family protein [Bacteroidota bacterium]